VLVPASAAGAAGGGACNLLSGLTGGCRARTDQPATDPGAPVSCGGTTQATVHGRRWTCTFDDEFAGSSLNRSKWVVQTTAQNGFHSGGECLTDDPRNLSVANGRLYLTVRRLPTSFLCASPKGSYPASWVGASVYTRTFDQLYGRFEIRARFPDAQGHQGLQSALWTYPRTMNMSNATGGLTEIDIAEAYSRYADWIAPAVHSYLSGRSVSCKVPDYGAAFHTYAVEWTRRAAMFYYDGTLCMRALGAGASQPFLVALSQVLGVTTNLTNAQTPSPATMQIDYVRVWK
jgi:beta-glucanase (GH16 family)